MAQLQPFVSNVPLQLAKNLRFMDANNIPVTELLPIGMNGLVVADSPTTGYISRIGALLSNQIDLYNNVNQTLQNYATDISDLQEAVAALEISGTTIPLVNGACFSGNVNAQITTVVANMASSVCSYNEVLGTTDALMQAILAEGVTALNLMPSFSVAGAKMQALAGWDPDPLTVAAAINNLWLSYLDSRAGVSSALALAIPSCSQNIIDFKAVYGVVGGNSGFSLYFSGYTFLPSAYSDNGSTFTITDGVGGVYTAGLNIVSASQPGADPLFVGISGTPLSTTAACYTVNVNSVVKSSSNTCTKNVIHTTCEGECGDCGMVYKTGTYSNDAFNTPLVIASSMPFVATYADVSAMDGPTAALLAQGKFVSINANTGALTLTLTAGQGTNLNIRWVAFK